MKTKIIPFDLETAKKVQAGEIEGRVLTEDGKPARILAFDLKSKYYPLAVAYEVEDSVESVSSFAESGEKWSGTKRLIIELIEEAPKHEFKPFDKVLVRENNGQVWHCDFYSYTDSVHGMHYCVGHCGEQILPYEGNEHLVGTTDKPNKVCL